MKHFLLTFMYITFSLGSLPESRVGDDFMFHIGFFENKPKVDRRVTPNSVFLFSVEL